jgi:hypothetical protein
MVSRVRNRSPAEGYKVGALENAGLLAHTVSYESDACNYHNRTPQHHLEDLECYVAAYTSSTPTHANNSEQTR